MPRPMKNRVICDLPENNVFIPLNPSKDKGEVIMSLDEYEAIRLIDYEGLTQEQCAARMSVARTTVQGIYESARRKIADFIINSKELTITGGAYRLCDGEGGFCGTTCRRRRRRGRRFQNG